MESKTKSSTKLVVTQAKKTAADGTVTYYFSTPKLKLWDIKGRLWVWKRMLAMILERK